MLKTFVVEKIEKDRENQGVWKKMTCEDPLASGYPTAVQLSRRSSRSVDSDSDSDSFSVSDSDPYSDPVTRYRTCGLSEKKLNLSNIQICIGEYP